MTQKKIFIPTSGPNDWRQLLADPDRHWRPGASAQSLAESWEAAAQSGRDWPELVQRALSSDHALAKLDIIAAFPEYKVDLPGGRRPSQTDLMVIARNDAGELAVIAVEGKVAEPFGDLVSEWRREPSEGRRQRLKFLLETIGLEEDDNLGALRYQLLHRTASAVLVARRFNATHAVVLVHSFHPESQWLSDFQSFATRYGAEVGKGQVSEVAEVGELRLHLGWVTES